MKAEIISVGTELLLGNIINTNSQYLAEELASIGIDVFYQTTVGDNEDRIIEITNSSLRRADILLYTGGLGPTGDDLTKESVCKAIGIDLILDNDALSSIKKTFSDRGIYMSKSNIKQAMVPRNSIILRNDNGTAPGIYLYYKDKIIIMLPGPPKEAIPMFDIYVKPMLKSLSNYIIKSKVIKTIDISESALEEILSDLIKTCSNPSLATYAKDDQIYIRITAKAQDDFLADKMILDFQSRIEAKIMKYIYGYDNDTLEDIVLRLAEELDLKLGFCESCTGGLVTSMLTKIPGASKVLDRSIITYSNSAKIEEVNVDAETLNTKGAVSKETAIQMAKGLLAKANLDLVVSITGIAGPSGGTNEKPVGLVYICLATKDAYWVYKNVFKGDRVSIQIKTTNAVYSIIRKYLLRII